LLKDLRAEGAGGEPPQGVAASWGAKAQQVLKKIVRLASVFPSPPFRSSDFAGLRRSRLYGFHTDTRSLSNRKGRGRRRGGREREARRVGVEQCIEPVHQAVHQSSPSEWAVPRVAGRFSDSETSWVLAGGAESSFLCSLSSRFSGRGGGVGSLPRAWRRVGVPRRCRC